MDHALYIAMTGAKENMNSLAIRGNNIANASTIGFKADFEQARAMQAYGEGHPTRVFALTERPGHDMSSGAINTTGRDLDVAIKGDGFIAVEDRNGKEAYVRTGSLTIDAEGVLRTASGLAVRDVSGNEVSIQMPVQSIFIRPDGTVQGVPEGMEHSNIEEFAQIKLVKPAVRDLYKGQDGLFRLNSGQNALEDPTVTLVNGAVEMSNVNVAAEMTQLIRIQRQFEANMKIMKTAEEMDQSSNSLLRLS
jgi:flagellar basal-body rod protein FlgF